MNAPTALAAATDLDDVLDDLSGIHTGIDLIRQGLALIATEQHNADRLQTIIAALAGSNGADVLTAIAHTLTTLTDSRTQDALLQLPAPRRKDCELQGLLAAYALNDPELHATASEASAAISQY